MKRLPIRASSPLLFCILLAAICACSDDSDNGAGPDDEIPTDLTDPAAVIDSHAKALRQQDYDAYEALLDDEFEFVPLARDAEDFPWVDAGSWPKAEELDMIGNMFNPEFSGQESPVDAIEAAVTVLSQQTLPNGRIELTTTMQGRVLTAANEGWSFDTRVIFELVTRGGFLRIAKMKEADAELGARGAGEGLEAATWASIKSLYRSAIPTDLTDPAAVIATHARALHERDLFAYQRLLDEEFEFFPLERDVADFPWLDGDSWPKADELLMIGHMFDPNFAGDENPVHQIDVDFTILFQQPLPSGRLQLKTAMQGRILTAANDGWSFDTIAFFELISREGFLRIAKIDEEDAVRAGDVRVEESSWGSIKAIYR